MRYQRVLQFPHGSLADYDAMILLEDRIDEALGALGELDGHDAGSGEMTIFFYTPEPKAAFTTIAALPVMATLKAAYRDVDDRYVVPHPAGSTDFDVA